LVSCLRPSWQSPTWTRIPNKVRMNFLPIQRLSKKMWAWKRYGSSKMMWRATRPTKGRYHEHCRQKRNWSRLRSARTSKMDSPLRQMGSLVGGSNATICSVSISCPCHRTSVGNILPPRRKLVCRNSDSSTTNLASPRATLQTLASQNLSLPSLGIH